MRALVEQHSAALARPGGAPVAGIVVTLRTVPVGDYPVYALYRAYFSVLYHFTHFAVNAVGSLVEHHGKQPFAFTGNSHHFFDLFRVHAGGLFANNV